MATLSTTTDTFENFLVSQGYLNPAQLLALQEQSERLNKPILDLVVGQKVLSEEILAKARGDFLNIPYQNFQQTKVDDQLMTMFPRDTMTFYKFFPFGTEDGGILKVAMIDPTNLQALEALEFFGKKLGYHLQFYITDEVSFKKVIDPNSRVVSEALADVQTKEKEERRTKEQKQGTPQNLQDSIKDAPISKIVDVILANAIDGGASDIHIEPSEKDLRVRYRLDGILHETLKLPKNVQNAIISRVKILSNLKIDESRLPQDGRFHFNTDIRSVDLRVSILPNVNGEKIVMRILDKTTKVPTLEELGFHGLALKRAKENIMITHGIFLVTGPTGSGKSTTLYSVLSMRNSPTVNIVTLEDPVEYFMEGVNQTQINPEIGLTFASGLRSILRQDPNIIMVGEIRDKETAELAVQSALTGHLVFSTLHTNNAIGALPRLMDMGIEPFLLIASINAIAAQRLTRKICPDCKHEIEVPDSLKQEIRENLKTVPKEELDDLDLDNIKLYAGSGCVTCGKTGYKGRMAIVEMFEITTNIQNLVLAKASPIQVFEEAQKLGMITMQQDGIIKSLKGIITYEEVVRVTSE